MPKIVDHDARRRHIAKAVHRIIHDKGMESVSLREVAAEAGMSMGTVQYYVRTKDQMLLLALEHFRVWIGIRVAAVTERQSAPLDLLRGTVLELLPLDDERRYLNRIGLAFQASSVVADDQAAAMRLGLPYTVLPRRADQGRPGRWATRRPPGCRQRGKYPVRLRAGHRERHPGWALHAQGGRGGARLPPGTAPRGVMDRPARRCVWPPARSSNAQLTTASEQGPGVEPDFGYLLRRPLRETQHINTDVEIPSRILIAECVERLLQRLH